MNCPNCKSKTNVIDVRSRGDVTARKRMCPKCKYVFYTKEVEEGGHEAFKHAWKMMIYERARKKEKS